MWSPTHVHVIVQRADNLLVKGKNGTNNAFVVMELGKDKYQTTIKEKAGKSVVWNEECELKIPKVGNAACLILTALHRNSLGLDQFLGSVRIPLDSFDKFQKSIEWYKLEGKPGKEKGKDKIRGELEVEIGFTSRIQSQSLTSLQSKGKSSFEQLTGSLFGLRQSDKRIGVKKFTNTLGRTILKKKRKHLVSSEDVHSNNIVNNNFSQSKNYNNLDPGVISDDEDENLNKSSESLNNEKETRNTEVSNNTVSPPLKPHRNLLQNPQISVSHWGENNKIHLSPSLNVSRESVSSTGSRKRTPTLEELKHRLADRRLSSSCVDFSLLTSPKPEKKFSSSLNLEKSQNSESHKKFSKFAKKFRQLHNLDKKDIGRTVLGCEAGGKPEEGSKSPRSEYKNKNKDELINMVVDLQKRVNCVSVRVKDLEEYLDDILVKVMDTVPKILEKS